MKKFGKGIIILIVLYIGVYAWMRYSGSLVRSAAGDPPVQVIGAKVSASAASQTKAEDADTAELTRSRGAVGETKVTVLNSVFWPLCAAEAWYWNRKG